MGLPSLQKTWTFDTNNAISYVSTTQMAQEVAYNLKEAMVAAGFAVVASSDQVSVKNVGDASPDLWTDYTKIERASSGIHSWCAIYSSTLDFTILIDCLSSYDYQFDIYAIRGTMNADGTTSARPTSVSGVEHFYSNKEFCPGRTYPLTRVVWHAMYSTDQHAFRFFARSDGTSHGHFTMWIQRPSNTPDLWVNPVIVHHTSSISSPIQWLDSELYADDAFTHAFTEAGVYDTYWTGEAFGGGNTPLSLAASTSPADLSSDAGYVMCPIGLASIVTGTRGSLGRLDDVWWRPLAMSLGDTLPADASRTMICIEDLILPWDGSVPVLE